MPGSGDVMVVGGGQAGLAAGYYLRSADLDYVILDAQPQPGGAWRHGWESLRLFSPAECSPLPGWGMPRQKGGEEFPTAGHVVVLPPQPSRSREQTPRSRTGQVAARRFPRPHPHCTHVTPTVRTGRTGRTVEKGPNRVSAAQALHDLVRPKGLEP